MGMAKKQRYYLALLLAALQLVAQQRVVLLHRRQRVVGTATLLEFGKLLLGALVLGVLGFEGGAVREGVFDIVAQRVCLGLQHALLLLGLSELLLHRGVCLLGSLRLLQQCGAFGGPEGGGLWVEPTSACTSHH